MHSKNGLVGPKAKLICSKLICDLTSEDRTKTQAHKLLRHLFVPISYTRALHTQ
jgi:hypothetical protein